MARRRKLPPSFLANIKKQKAKRKGGAKKKGNPFAKRGKRRY